MKPFQSLHEYEEFVYSLARYFPSVIRSTLIVVRRGTHTAVLRGELSFEHGFRLTVQERLSCDVDVKIVSYGYELWSGSEKIAWYDSQPHPNDSVLAATFPHHKHLPPDMKHHRLPAPTMSFLHPNLPELIREIEALLQTERPPSP